MDKIIKRLLSLIESADSVSKGREDVHPSYRVGHTLMILNSKDGIYSMDVFHRDELVTVLNQKDAVSVIHAINSKGFLTRSRILAEFLGE
jgi:hypothetical protein